MKKKTVLIIVAALAVTLLAACTKSGEAASSSGSSIWGIIAVPLGYLMRWCYLFVTDILKMPKAAYIIALFLFTLITKALMFPLSIKQQRSTAMMAAYKPMIDEINKKYANNREKLNEEMQKLQTEYGYNPMSGCLPMLIQFPIIFGLIEVIYRPLTYMLRLPAEFIAEAEAITRTLTTVANDRLVETNVIQLVKENIGAFSSLSAQYGEQLTEITNFNMSIGPINLWEKPVLGFSWTLLVPLFSIVTMLLSTVITMRKSGQAEASGGAGKSTMYVTSLLFGVFSFMYPMGFSLYWGFQNLISIGQSFILYKICNPQMLREEAAAKLAEKKKAKKEIKKVTYTDGSGNVVEKELKQAELDKLRLQKARELDDSRYDN